jgi:Uma2 family endonuclease
MLYPQPSNEGQGRPVKRTDLGVIKPERRHETIDGKKFMLPSPSKNHQRIRRNLERLFDTYLIGRPCEVFSETDIHLDKTNTLKPDIMVICDPYILNDPDTKLKGVPDLVIEILSPGTVNHDKKRKMKLYAEYGVKEYWIVDPDNLSVDVYLLNTDLGIFEFEKTYRLYSDEIIAELKTEIEKQDAVMEIKPTIFKDLIIRLSEVFYKVR